MENEAFRKWWNEEYYAWHTYNSERDRSVADIAYEAAQSASAARIAELEAKIEKYNTWRNTQTAAWERVCDDWSRANIELTARIAELEERVNWLTEENRVLEWNNNGLSQCGLAADKKRIAELEAKNKRLKEIYVMDTEELEADCKAMAEALRQSHKPDNTFADPPFIPMRKVCECSACLIAAKYKDAESTAREEGK